MEEGKGLRSLNCKVVGEVAQVTVKSHWQEPAVFSPFVSGGELKGVQGERTEVKSAREGVRQEQSEKRKAPEEKRRLKERFV